jgi:hypothetical protein
MLNHGSEMPIVFGSSEYYRHVSDTNKEAKVVKSMMTARAAFAKDPEGGLSRMGWPEFDESSELYYEYFVDVANVLLRAIFGLTRLLKLICNQFCGQYFVLEGLRS